VRFHLFPEKFDRSSQIFHAARPILAVFDADPALKIDLS
jgi:hypothetical protein